jgi:hypothetical protein
VGPHGVTAVRTLLHSFDDWIVNGEDLDVQYIYKIYGTSDCILQFEFDVRMSRTALAASLNRKIAAYKMNLRFASQSETATTRL